MALNIREGTHFLGGKLGDLLNRATSWFKNLQTSSLDVKLSNMLGDPRVSSFPETTLYLWGNTWIPVSLKCNFRTKNIFQAGC